MGTQELTVELLLKRQDVTPYVKQVVDAAESDRSALGWYARSVYEEAASSEKLSIGRDQQRFTIVDEGGNVVGPIEEEAWKCFHGTASS